MSDTERVRAWRQRLKDAGQVPMTIWVKAETKARYDDLALQSHRSPSEVAQLALDAYRPGPAMVAVRDTDTEQLRALIRDELDQTTAIITATVTATVTEIITAALPSLVETTLQRYVAETVPDTDTATLQEPSWVTTVEAFVSDMETDTDTDTTAGEPLQESAPHGADIVTDAVTATPQAPHIAAPGEAPTAATATATAMEAGAGVPVINGDERSATATETATQGEPRLSSTERTLVADTATATAMEAGAGIPAPTRDEHPVADTETVTETDTGRMQRGQRRLTPLQAAELRGKRAAGMPIKALMQEYGLSRATVHRYLTAPPGV